MSAYRLTSFLACSGLAFNLVGLVSGQEGPLVMLPLDTGAACLDGSAYGFYKINGTNTSKFTISLDGGGWCRDEDDCVDRSTTDKGSSKLFAKTGYCFDAAGYDPQLITEGQCIHLPYCDGASFSGYRKSPWPAGNSSLFFRGARNLEATLDFLQDELAGATEIVVTGSSAGGLAVLLHLDEIAARVHRVAPAATVRGVSDAGFFLDHADYQKDKNDFPAEMKYVVAMQNASLNPECTQNFIGEDAYKCFMSPHAVPFTKTPYFLLNRCY
jgi:hypothetical protein